LERDQARTALLAAALFRCARTSPHPSNIIENYWIDIKDALPDRLAQAVGDGLQVVCHAVVKAHPPGIHSRANSQLVHVETGSWVIQAATLSQGNHLWQPVV
jgi:hypothetical protein